MISSIRCVQRTFVRLAVRNVRSSSETSDIIRKITKPSATPLLPEIQLHLITTECDLWTSSPEHCPVPDPYWAFLWPGGQALSRFLLDNPSITKEKNILDIGSGCGASVISALKCGANHVVANDIDPIALTSVKLNMELNFSEDALVQLLAKLVYYGNDILLDHENCYDKQSIHNFRILCNSMSINSYNFVFDVILIGDLFYEESIVTRLFNLLRAIHKLHPETKILIGDPGRPFLLEHSMLKHLDAVCEYKLPDSCIEKNYGFSTACVYEFCK
ncbi:electron transfer flavoprotein beta subunit lysine methyltransferase homolog [Styela clava]